LLITLFFLTYILNFCFVFASIYSLIKRGKKTVFLGFSIGYVVTNYIGIMVLFLGWDEYRQDIGVTDKITIIKIFLFSVLSYWIVYVSAFYRRNIDVNTRKLILSRFDKYMYLIMCVLVAGFSFLYIRSLDNIALFHAFIGSEGVDKMRSEMGNANQSSHWIRLFINVFCVFWGYISIILVKQTQKIRYKILNVIAQLGVIVLLLIDTSKFAIIQYFIGLLAIEYFLGDGKLKGKMLRLAILGFAGIFGMYYLFASLDNIGIILQAASSRMVTGSIAPSYFYLQYIDQTGNYFLGTSFPNPGGVFGYTPISVSVFIMDWWFGYSDDGIVGSSPTTFWAEAYVNFSIIGIVIFSSYMGLLIRLLDSVISKYSHRLVLKAAFGWFSAFIFTANISGISEFLKPIFIVALGSIIILGISKYGKQ